MALSRQELEQLIQFPRESLDTELKQWIDPRTPEGIAKIARACIALRNNNGGCLIVGFKDDGTPDPNALAGARERFHVDVVQGIVGKYASSPFSVAVEFVSRDGIEYPVICLEGGVVTPVLSKSDLNDASGRPLIKCDCVYVRTIHSNNTVSTSPARAADYDRLIKICFDNREADIGAFIRRHLATANIAKLHELLTLAEPEVSLPERVEKFLNVGLGRYHSMLASRQLEIGEIATFEVAVVIEGEIPKYSANEDFYYRLQLNKPHHSGWPFWIDLHNSGDQADRPYVAQGGWEALVQANIMGYSLDFWRAEPSGNFYHLRSLQDDWHQGDNVAPRKFLDFALHTGRVAEVVSIGSHFAKALGCDEQNTTLGFATRWHGLAGRNLYSWSQPSRSFFSRGAAVENDITTVATMPLSVTAFSPVVESLMSPVFELFGGMRFQSSVIEGIVQNVLGRRM